VAASIRFWSNTLIAKSLVMALGMIRGCVAKTHRSVRRGW
jgi:hypothetical protein